MDAVNYILFTNPVSATALKTVYKGGELLQGFLVPKQKVEIVKMDPLPLWKLASKSGFFVRAAGVSGAAAVILGAYGAHVLLTNKDKSDVEKRTFETASKYHFFHSLALLGVPFARYPAISGSLFLVGISLFCGTCYYCALTGDSRLNRLTPVGGMSFIFGWLALAVL